MINRALIILRAKQPAVDWINLADPIKKRPVTLEAVNLDCPVHLIHEEAESQEEAHVWALMNHEILLEEFMHGWYVDESLWIKNLSPEMFNQWFDVEFHSMIIDTLETPIKEVDW